MHRLQLWQLWQSSFDPFISISVISEISGENFTCFLRVSAVDLSVNRENLRRWRRCSFLSLALQFASIRVYSRLILLISVLSEISGTNSVLFPGFSPCLRASAVHWFWLWLSYSVVNGFLLPSVGVSVKIFAAGDDVLSFRFALQFASIRVYSRLILLISVISEISGKNCFSPGSSPCLRASAVGLSQHSMLHSRNSHPPPEI